MEKYKNFKLASLVYAYYLDGKTEEQIQADIDFYQQHMPLNKAYLEAHRGLVDISSEQLQMAKRVFERNGIEVSGCITTTVLVNDEPKPSIFDTFCFTDPTHRESLKKIVAHTAENFDEIILDDYFFTACRCEQCIKAKGSRTWAEYKLQAAKEVSQEIVDLAKSINPKINFIIKYPNWYEAYQECGYNPEEQKDIFDMIYTGTESRNSNYNGQHLQRYMSYSLVRYLENIAPGRNGGGWIDPGGSQRNLTVLLEQAELTYFAKAKELMLFNFEAYLHQPSAGALGIDLQHVDEICGHLGNPVGISTYEPHNSDGEDQLINYIGQCGIPLEPVPYFDENAKTIFLTQNSAKDPDVVTKLEKFVREGGTAIVTSGFMRKTIDKGLSGMTSVRPTDRKVTGTRYSDTALNISTHNVEITDQPATFTVMDYKNNATWYNVLLHVDDNSVAIITDDQYGKGRLYILNIPDNYGDLYKLPKGAWTAIAKAFCRNGEVYLSAAPQTNLYLYDNDVFGIYNLREFKQPLEVILRGEDILGFEDVITGQKFLEPHHLNPQPRRMGDSATFEPEPLEKVFEVPIGWGSSYKFFKLIRK